MEFETIGCDVAHGIATLKLNRPDKRNALSIRMRREISACLGRWRDNPAVGVVVITGAGAAFSAGFDLDEFQREELFEGLFESSSRYHRDVWYFPKPTIAAVNGPAIGGAFDLACLCDVRIASKGASFGHPEIKLGAPPLFTPLRWIVGDGIARDLCLTGRRIDAEEALRIRLVSAVVDADGLAERAMQVATSILEAPTHALQYTKAYLVANAGASFEESFHVEHDRAFQELILKDRRAPGAG